MFSLKNLFFALGSFWNLNDEEEIHIEIGLRDEGTPNERTGMSIKTLRQDHKWSTWLGDNSEEFSPEFGPILVGQETWCTLGALREFVLLARKSQMDQWVHVEVSDDGLLVQEMNDDGPKGPGWVIPRGDSTLPGDCYDSLERLKALYGAKTAETAQV